MAEGECDSADLAVAAFTKNDFQHTGPGCPLEKRHLGRARDRAVENHASPPLPQLLFRGQASHRDSVGLAMVVAGVRELQREFPLVAEQQGPSALCIQSTDGVQTIPQMRWHKVEHGFALLWITAAADHSRWFVQQKNAWFGGSLKGAPVHLHIVLVEISLVADGC